MKVVHCIGALEGGGAETQLELLCKQLDSIATESVEHVIIYLNAPNQNYGFNKKISYSKIASKNLFGRWIEIYKILRVQKAAVIQMWLPAIFIYFSFPAFLLGLRERLIWTVCSAYKLDSFKRLIHLMLYGFATKVVTNTHPDDIKGLYGVVLRLKKTYYIPNAIKYSVSKSLPSSMNFENRPIHFLSVGRLIKEKNHDLLIDALEKLKNGRIQLAICGQGIEYVSLRKKINQFILDDNVSLEGHVNNVADYYDQADIFVSTSSREGMPNVVFEAATRNNVLILSDIEPHRRWFTSGENAILFRNKDISSLVEAIELVLSETEEFRQRLADNASKLALTLTDGIFIKKFQQLYQSII